MQDFDSMNTHFYALSREIHGVGKLINHQSNFINNTRIINFVLSLLYASLCKAGKLSSSWSQVCELPTCQSSEFIMVMHKNNYMSKGLNSKAPFQKRRMKTHPIHPTMSKLWSRTVLPGLSWPSGTLRSDGPRSLGRGTCPSPKCPPWERRLSFGGTASRRNWQGRSWSGGGCKREGQYQTLLSRYCNFYLFKCYNKISVVLCQLSAMFLAKYRPLFDRL